MLPVLHKSTKLFNAIFAIIICLVSSVNAYDGRTHIAHISSKTLVNIETYVLSNKQTYVPNRGHVEFKATLKPLLVHDAQHDRAAVYLTSIDVKFKAPFSQNVM